MVWALGVPIATSKSIIRQRVSKTDAVVVPCSLSPVVGLQDSQETFAVKGFQGLINHHYHDLGLFTPNGYSFNLCFFSIIPSVLLLLSSDKIYVFSLHNHVGCLQIQKERTYSHIVDVGAAHVQLLGVHWPQLGDSMELWKSQYTCSLSEIIFLVTVHARPVIKTEWAAIIIMWHY